MHAQICAASTFVAPAPLWIEFNHVVQRRPIVADCARRNCGGKRARGTQCESKGIPRESIGRNARSIERYSRFEVGPLWAWLRSSEGCPPVGTPDPTRRFWTVLVGHRGSQKPPSLLLSGRLGRPGRPLSIEQRNICSLEAGSCARCITTAPDNRACKVQTG